MPNNSKAETYLAKERCACGHKRIAHIHYKRNPGTAEVELSFCGYPTFDAAGNSIYCPCEKYEKADVLPHQPFKLSGLRRS